MSVCAGKTKCEIYRQKKYCRKNANVDENHECVGCRHAKRQCEVGHCVFGSHGMCMMEQANYVEVKPDVYGKNRMA